MSDRDTELQELLRQITDLKGEITKLKLLLEQKSHMIRKLKDILYGPKSEKRHADEHLQMILDGLFKELTESATGHSDEATSDEPEKPEVPKNKPKRRALPANLRRKTEKRELPQEELFCKKCSKTMGAIGGEVSEFLEFIPAQLYVHQIQLIKYACPDCKDEPVVYAKPPRRIVEKGIAGDSLVVNTIINKYCDHIPLHRQEKILARNGVKVNRSTMVGWIAAASEWSEAIVEYMADKVRESDCIKTDATGLPVLPNGINPKKLDPAKLNKAIRGHLWCYLGDNGHMVFNYTRTHEAAGPASFLKGFKGYVQSDAHGVYKKICKEHKDELVGVGCWAHARRKFVQAEPSNKNLARQAIGMIRKMYDVERTAKELKVDSQALLKMRQDVSAGIVAEFLAWCEATKKKVLPKSPLGNAVGYALDNRKELSRFLSDPSLGLDNNDSERALRHSVIGRKNWMFAGSEEGARRMANIYSLIYSCILNNIDPFTYLTEMFHLRVNGKYESIEELTPKGWKEARIRSGNPPPPYYPAPSD